jgi:hypothetical protein
MQANKAHLRRSTPSRRAGLRRNERVRIRAPMRVGSSWAACGRGNKIDKNRFAWRINANLFFFCEVQGSGTVDPR